MLSKWIARYVINFCLVFIIENSHQGRIISNANEKGIGNFDADVCLANGKSIKKL